MQHLCNSIPFGFQLVLPPGREAIMLDNLSCNDLKYLMLMRQDDEESSAIESDWKFAAMVLDR